MSEVYSAAALSLSRHRRTTVAITGTGDITDSGDGTTKLRMSFPSRDPSSIFIGQTDFRMTVGVGTTTGVIGTMRRVKPMRRNLKVNGEPGHRQLPEGALPDPRLREGALPSQRPREGALPGQQLREGALPDPRLPVGMLPDRSWIGLSSSGLSSSGQ
ncbi:MAG TPA: hypothetical protein VMH85_10570 [Terriglobales bacterium]|nr:hypothetical protein [Terriglobales bacterium]